MRSGRIFGTRSPAAVTEDDRVLDPGLVQDEGSSHGLRQVLVGDLQARSALLALPEWRMWRALRLGLIPPAGADGRWPATVAEDAVARLETLRGQIGVLPDVGGVPA
ncbi:hypothetical protein GCM10023324_26690 [Streptomyces youssoufiensis]